MDKKVVLITGASSGIGREIAVFLAKHNYKVYGVARRTDKLQELHKLGVETMPMDVTDEDSVKSTIDAIIKREGTIDVLVNNAGYGEYGAIEDVSIENARYQMDVNVFGLARITQLVLPFMRKQQSGNIINISSTGGKIANPLGGWYHASKFAVEALSDSLRLEVKQFGINVTVIEPGGIKSEWGGIAFGKMMEASKGSVYADYANKMYNFIQNMEKNNSAPEPIVIAELIKKAIESKKPKARYAAGAMAKPLLFMKRYLSDSMFDRIILRIFFK
ncbi:oxidoreductase [Maribellus maritimus]|uniref:oxidoreductase n=1 Tax=Maribellus maritimus TaxID=2870838 RepID=UPI001EEA20F8|nr:oxidoreductase [Maribellus maritimus]MCG6188678.1 SDR family NAD(P)-dependent oxidoreductase [Maribellus maritimus]